MRALLLTLLLASVCFAQQSMPDATLGTRPGAFSARGLSLGHTYLTDETGPASVMGNPATLTVQDQPWRFDVTGNLSRMKETRKYPFYDAFNAVQAWNNYAVNDHVYTRLNGGLAYKIPTSLVESFVVSGATYSAYDFDYTYHEEVRARYSSGGIMDLKLGDNKLDIKGDMRTFSFGAAAKAKGPLAVGFSVNALTGKWDYTKGVYYTSPDSANLVQKMNYKPKDTPMEVNVGATYAIGERVSIGARALMPTGDFKFKFDGQNIHGDTSLAYSGDITVPYPSHYAIGASYRPKSDARPVLLLEGEIHTYKDVSELYDNTFEIRAGAEQQIVPGAPVRIGFVYATSPLNKDRATTLFTAGLGFHLQKLTGDFGLEFGKLNYTNPDLFPNSLYGGANRVDVDRIETSVFRGMISLRYDI
jgi:hypothetical protein